MNIRSVSLVLLFSGSLVAGCNGCLKYKPRLAETEVRSIADQAMAELGYDLKKTAPLIVNVGYLQGSCAWGVDYTLYGDRLPAGPTIFIDDRTRAAGIGPSM